MDKAQLSGPIHRFGDWIIDNFVRLPRWLRIPLWRYWHSRMIDWDTEYQALKFMNYGYAPIDEDDLPLKEEDRTERFGAHLYHYAVSHVPVRDRTILEVSSGRGGGASYIARYLEPKRYIGLDISDENVTGCRRIYGSIPNLSFVQGMAEKLPFDDGSIDYVLSVEASRAYSDVGEFFREVRRVLGKDGRFLLTDMRKREDVEPLRHQLAESGFSWEREVDISANVVRALERDNERKTTLMKQRIPRMFLSAFSEFAGTIGSGRYSDFRDGRMIYFSWCLKPVSNKQGEE